ncbi:hypothetical protein GCM10017781_33360 [Deinococcus metalli]|uniref:Uncharacterized protein n=1 Tax=Deinococcus metalli TaxID=1141878 RepID=A0ABQ3JSE6_9DEIO|nr:hypothetical protein GCM10017781_33360 [Deinococcus metalli]
MDEHVVVPDMVWEVTPSELTGPERCGDLTLDKRQDLPPLIVKSQGTRSAAEPGLPYMRQQIEHGHGDSPVPAQAPDGLAYPHNLRVRTTAEGNFKVIQRLFSC